MTTTPNWGCFIKTFYDLFEVIIYDLFEVVNCDLIYETGLCFCKKDILCTQKSKLQTLLLLLKPWNTTFASWYPMVTLFGALPPSASRWSVPTWLLSTTGPKLGYMAKVAKKRRRRRNRRAILYFNFLKCAFVVNQSFKVTDNIQMLSTKSARAQWMIYISIEQNS